jgi:hypothetical protein
MAVVVLYSLTFRQTPDSLKSLANLIWFTKLLRDSDIGLEKLTSVSVAKTHILAIVSY